MRKAIFPGSFDPITVGHVDVIKRAVPLFDEIIIAIGTNSTKKYIYTKILENHAPTYGTISIPSVKETKEENIQPQNPLNFLNASSKYLPTKAILYMTLCVVLELPLKQQKI